MTMKRTFATTTLAVALLGIGACKGGGAGDAAKLVPDSATVIGGVDLKAAMGSALYKDNQKMLEEGEGKEALEAAKACNLGPDKFKSIVFGADPTGGDAKMMFVISADGIGKKENLECIHGKIKEKEGEDPWTMEEKDGKMVLTIDGGDATGYVVSDGMLAVAGKDWAGSVKELIDGKGKAAIDNSLKDVVGRTDTSKTMWAAGSIPSEMASGPADGAKDAAGWVDLSGGLELMASVGFGSADDAKKKAEEFNTMFEGAKGGAAAFGVPEAVVNSIKIEAKDSAVAVSAKASAEDVKKISENAGKALGGLM